MSRSPIIAANWKMNHTPSETAAFFEAFLPQFPEPTSVDIVVAPSFVSLAKASEYLAGQSTVALSAQNMSPEASGAYTGEISADMLLSVGCRYVILGHSERRSLYGEDDAFINRKVHAALGANLVPILCIGESLEERDGGRLETVLTEQLEGSLAGIDATQMPGVVIAYEPVWAIGTGRTATADDAQEMCAAVRGALRERYPDFGARVRVLYGGSMKPSNAAELLAKPDVNGGLIGGASLEIDDLLAIERATA